jgi:hypothetical protein
VLLTLGIAAIVGVLWASFAAARYVRRARMRQKRSKADPGSVPGRTPAPDSAAYVPQQGPELQNLNRRVGEAATPRPQNYVPGSTSLRTAPQ